MKKDPLSYSLEDIRTCLSSGHDDPEQLQRQVRVADRSQPNQFSFFWNGAEKVRNARDASDLRPLETTYRQLGVTRTDLGSSWWKTGMPKTYKWSDRHIFSDRFMVEVLVRPRRQQLRADVPRGGPAQRAAVASRSRTSAYARSFQESCTSGRPTASTSSATTSCPGSLGGDHALKFGFKCRNDIAYTETTSTAATPSPGYRSDVAERGADLYRDSVTEYGLHNRNFYIQDSYTRNRMTINLGIRFDHQSD